MAVDYASEVLEGSPRAAARVISWLENEDDRATPVMEALYPHTGKAAVIGITGAPGAGKSTLTDKLIQAMRNDGLTVGVVAVDPSSPFTGGAILGDRVRMSRFSTDPGVFIRSMATRGHLGGLARATADVVKVLDAQGKDVVIIETVGVGQDEVDIMRLADTTCVVLVPGLGDTIQSMKAGLMEIADIFVINKADRPGADQLYSEVAHRIEQDAQMHERDWTPPVLKTVAVDDQGVDALWAAIRDHWKYLDESGRLEARRRDRAREETLRMIHNEIFRKIHERLAADGELERIVDRIVAARESPYGVTRRIAREWLRVDDT